MHPLRTLLRTPVFTAVAVLTLALGLGANIAIFSLVDAVMLRRLPVPHPAQLAFLTDPNDTGTSVGSSGGRRGLLAYSEYVDQSDHNPAFTGLLAAESGIPREQIRWDGGAASEPVRIKLVSANYFNVLEIPAWRGRTFAATEGQKIGADPIAVMSYAYWNQRFHRSAAVLGRSFDLHGHPFTVIGVTPPGFFGEAVGQSPDLWIPLTMQPQALPGLDRLHDPPGMSRVMWLQVMGRLKPGVTLSQAQSASELVFQRSVERQASGAGSAASRRSLMNQYLRLTSGALGVSGVRGQFRDPLLALFALVGLVLVLAVVNLASLLLARAASRQREVGVRLALGAGRGHILRQLLSESLLLGVAGGVLGCLFALWGERSLLAMVTKVGGSVSLGLAPDWRVVLFVPLVSLAAGALVGLPPALRLARLDANASLNAQSRGAAAGRQWLGKVLIVAQLAISIVLLVGASLFVRSLQKLQNVPLGFRAAHLGLLSVDTGPAGYANASALTYFRRARAGLKSLPGVQGVALAEDGLFDHSDSGLPVAIAGYTPPKGRTGTGSAFDTVSPNYFAVVGMPILLGRSLTAQDETGPKHAVVNQTFVRLFFGNRNPLGRQLIDLYPDDHRAVYTIVGVCADAKYDTLGEKTPPRFYLPFGNAIPLDNYHQGVLMIRGTATAAAIRAALKQLDPAVQLGTYHSLTALVGESLASQQMLAQLSGFFGVLALLLAAIGLYGVMSYALARRTSEIGIRMALGASPGTVLAMVLREILVLVGIGVALGVPASVAGARLVASQIRLFGLAFYDPASLAAAGAILAGVALAAGILPARRASRIDPLIALRQD
jgi:predicted permease